MEEPDVSDTASSGQDQEEVSQAVAACVFSVYVCFNLRGMLV